MKIKKRSASLGFTLVELIVAFAVLGIAVLGIGGFFVTSVRSYSSVNAETSLQQEAQLSLNQVENMLIDSTLGVSYNFVTDEDAPETGFHFVKTDSEASGEAKSKVLYAFNVDEADGSNFKALLLKWSKDDEAIYYKEIEQPQSAGATVKSIDIKGNGQDTGWDLLSEGVKEFSVDLSKYEKTKKIEVRLSIEKKNKEYQAEGIITLRNNVLINEDSIEKIYENVNKIIKSEITGVELTATPTVTVPGGVVQLRAKVLGTGYPSQEIYRWYVAYTSDIRSDSIIFDSLADSDSATYINTADQTLTISPVADIADSTFHETLWVQAIVDTGKTDDSGNRVYVNDIQSIAIKLIDNITVSVEADKSLSENSDLPDEERASATLAAQKGSNPEIPVMSLNPNNVVQMKAEVTGSDSLTASDKEILWSIVNKTDGVVADIDASGRLQVNKYSQKGSFIVRAALKIDRNSYVDYAVSVGNQFDGTNSVVEMTAPTNQLNRGGTVQCALKMNNTPISANDFNWSATVSNGSSQSLVDSPVYVNTNGLLSAADNLSYDYSYSVLVKAELKSNPAIFATKIFTIPKVSVVVSPKVKFTTMGTTVKGIIAKAVGIENYDISWTMAKDTNPNYFFTAFGKSHIDGKKNADGTGEASVTLGSNEPKTNVTVKAALKGNSNYYDTMQLRTGDVNMWITGSTKMLRGQSNQLNVNTEPANIGITNSTVKWEITNATGKKSNNWYPGYPGSGGSTTSLNTQNLSITNGRLTVPSNYYTDYKDIVITVSAYDAQYDIKATYTVEVVNDFNLSVSPTNVLIPDGSNLSVKFTAYIDGSAGTAEWSTTAPADRLVINDDGILNVVANSKNVSDNGIYTVTASVAGKTANASVQFGFTDISKGISNEKELNNKDGVKFTGAKSSYEVVTSDGVRHPVCYIRYTEYSRWGYAKKIENYAFVSNSNRLEGSGTWYELEDGTWNESSAPPSWNNRYFNSFNR